MGWVPGSVGAGVSTGVSAGLDPKKSHASRRGTRMTQIRGQDSQGRPMRVEAVHGRGAGRRQGHAHERIRRAAGVRRDRRPVALSVRHAPELDHRDCNDTVLPGRTPAPAAAAPAARSAGYIAGPTAAPHLPDHGSPCPHRRRRYPATRIGHRTYRNYITT